jgi:hypothetical protein
MISSGGRIRTCNHLLNRKLRYHCATPDFLKYYIKWTGYICGIL